LEKNRFACLITDAAKTIYTYCRTRTHSKEEAEDLSQDILLELLNTQGNLRDDKAFYGFMWAVVGNVYKNWCKKRKKSINYELDESIPDSDISLPELLERKSYLSLLYRELGLLTEQYRKAVILYYFNEAKVADISKSLAISESMVKFLLFKSRKILKEGMNMERSKGDLSFNPGRMMLACYGGSTPIDPALFEKNLIAQNILLACYYERCTAEEISLQMGVAIPYLERDLKELCAGGVLIQKGGRYETAVVIFTKDFSLEADTKTLTLQREIADIIEKFLDERLADIKAIGFYQGGLDDGLLRWRITQLILEQAVLNKYEKSLNLEFPKYAGHEVFLFGIEDFNSRHSGCLTTNFNNDCGDRIKFLEFFFSGFDVMMDMGYFMSGQNRVNVFLEIAKGKMDGFNENDMLEVAELIKYGFVKKEGTVLHVSVPVYTAEQYKQVVSLMDAVTDKVAEKTHKIIEATTEILIQHTPAKMKKDAQAICWLKRHDLAMGGPVEIMRGNSTLRKIADNERPTSYVLLQQL